MKIGDTVVCLEYNEYLAYGGQYTVTGMRFNPMWDRRYNPYYDPKGVEVQINHGTSRWYPLHGFKVIKSTP